MSKIDMYYKSKNANKDCKAVSPVIGAIVIVAITVVLAAVIGTFVLGLGDSTSEPARAGISIESGEDNVELTVVDKGNLEAIRIVAPDGTRSPLYSSSNGILRTGMEIELQDGGFAPSSIEPAISGNGGAMNLVNGDLKEGEGPKYDVPLPGDKQNQLTAVSTFPPFPSGISPVESECKVQVPGVIKGIDTNGKKGLKTIGFEDGVGEEGESPVIKNVTTNKRPDVGCSFQNLEAFIFDFTNPIPEDELGDPIGEGPSPGDGSPPIGEGPSPGDIVEPSPEPSISCDNIPNLLEGPSNKVTPTPFVDGTSARFKGYCKKIDEIGASGKIRYMSGQYKIVGVVDGKETVVTSFEVED